LPDHISGLQKLTVQNAQGLQTVNVFLESAVPAIFTLNGSGTGAGAVIRTGNFISLYLTGLGDSTGTPVVTLNGAAVNVTYAGAAPGYPGLDQINFELPAGVTSGTVVVVANGRVSNAVTI
jgi:uncharacterized protein (TIGR03437 family)